MGKLFPSVEKCDTGGVKGKNGFLFRLGGPIVAQCGSVLVDGESGCMTNVQLFLALLGSGGQALCKRRFKSVTVGGVPLEFKNGTYLL